MIIAAVSPLFCVSISFDEMLDGLRPQYVDVNQGPGKQGGAAPKHRPPCFKPCGLRRVVLAL
jgi:hypothetical protein